jgi:murein DD-endopeptidase MepM/ murein hydrolase activator NlpD
MARLQGTDHFFIQHTDDQRQEAIERIANDSGLSDLGRSRLATLVAHVNGVATLPLIRLSAEPADRARGRVLLGFADFVLVHPDAASLEADDVFLSGMRVLEPKFWREFARYNERLVELSGLRLVDPSPGRWLIESSDGAALLGDGEAGAEARSGSPLTHVLVAFSGAQFVRGSEPVGGAAMDNVKDAFMRVARRAQLGFARPGEVLMAQPCASYVGGQPGIVGVDGVQLPADFIQRHVSRDREGHPTGKIVVFGYSWGGFNAIDLAWQLQGLGLPVDLLITIDATRGCRSGEAGRSQDEQAITGEKQGTANWSKNPTPAKRYPHEGLDILGEPGTSVVSPITGTITKIGLPYAKESRPRYVEITGNGRYAGMVVRVLYLVHPVSVRVGANVTQGATVLGTLWDHIPEQPSSAKGIKPHVHLEVRHNGVLVDPSQLIDEWRER